MTRGSGPTHPTPTGPPSPSVPPPRYSATPMTFSQREENYRMQRGGGFGVALTPQQKRRLKHKANRAIGKAVIYDETATFAHAP